MTIGRRWGSEGGTEGDAVTEEVSYAEYLAIVREQEARDRDRFMGHDSHEGQPMYSADSGAMLLDIGDHSIDDMKELFARAREAAEKMAAEMLAFMNDLMFGTGPAEPLGILHAGPGRSLRSLPKKGGRAKTPRAERHTYPKPQREWWNRR